MAQVKKTRAKMAEYYRIEGNKLERAIPFCSRCGRGYFMADHGDRFACGRCGYTVFKGRR